jgi:hypothetical protein
MVTIMGALGAHAEEQQKPSKVFVMPRRRVIRVEC